MHSPITSLFLKYFENPNRLSEDIRQDNSLEDEALVPFIYLFHPLDKCLPRACRLCTASAKPVVLVSSWLAAVQPVALGAPLLELQRQQQLSPSIHSFGNGALPNDTLRNDVLAFPPCILRHTPYLRHLFAVTNKIGNPLGFFFFHNKYLSRRPPEAVDWRALLT
jgi:hypothetical protein